MGIWVMNMEDRDVEINGFYDDKLGRMNKTRSPRKYSAPS